MQADTIARESRPNSSANKKFLQKQKLFSKPSCVSLKPVMYILFVSFAQIYCEFTSGVNCFHIKKKNSHGIHFWCELLSHKDISHKCDVQKKSDFLSSQNSHGIRSWCELLSLKEISHQSEFQKELISCLHKNNSH